MGALAARFARIKRIIFTAHGWAFREDRSTLAKKVIGFFSWVTVILCHTTITLHERDLRAFDQWPFTKKKIIKIHNGIRPELILSRQVSRNKLGEKYGVTITERLIGTVAELHKNKGLAYLIGAMRKIPENVGLCIIGEGEERKKLESLIRREHLNARVCLPGFIPDAHKLMQAFDIFVLPSVKEGFPFVLLEAGVAQVPIVATAVGGIPEIIENKKEGLLVSPKNTEVLAETIRTLLDDKKIGELYTTAFAKKIKTQFNFDSATLPQTMALYIL